MYYIEKLKKHYSHNFVLDIPMLTFEKHQIHVLCGGNGAGKTTLLKILAFLLAPSEGRIVYKGKPQSFSYGMHRDVRQSISFLAQDPYFFKGTVFDNVAFGFSLRGYTRREIKKQVAYMLAIMGLSEYSHKPIHTLSGGQKQRVACARVWGLPIEVLLLDEPTAFLDEESKEQFEAMIAASRGVRTIIMTTHDPMQAQRISDKIYYMSAGQIVPTPLRRQA